MHSILLQPLRRLAQALLAHDSPRQVAWAVVLGMFLGLLPKGNLTALGLATLLAALRVNRSAGLFAAGIFSVVGFGWDGLAHHVGALALVWAPVRPLHVWLYQLPLGPWLGLNNTVVVGQLLMGLYLAYPVFWLTLQFATHVQPRLSDWLLRYRVVRWLRGAELGAHWGENA